MVLTQNSLNIIKKENELIVIIDESDPNIIYIKKIKKTFSGNIFIRLMNIPFLK